MKNTLKKHTVLTEKIFEIRYKPNPNFIDFRGQALDIMLSGMKMTEWQLIENRVDFGDKDNQRRGYIDFKRAGLVIIDKDDPEFFIQNAKKFVELFFQQPPFSPSFVCERIGVRFQYAIEFTGKFETLFEKFTSRVYNLHEKANQALNGQIIDIGSPITLKTPNGIINIHLGPMDEKQLATLFLNRSNLFSTSLYLDFDYSQKPSKEISIQELSDIITLFAQGNHERYINIRNLVLE